MSLHELARACTPVIYILCLSVLQVFADLKLNGGVVGKENLLVRWAGKKRDRVDEILVRELQQEEAVWTDYSQDELMVKDQITETILQSLLADSVQVFIDIYRKRENSQN